MTRATLNLGRSLPIITFANRHLSLHVAVQTGSAFPTDSVSRRAMAPRYGHKGHVQIQVIVTVYPCAVLSKGWSDAGMAIVGAVDPIVATTTPFYLHRTLFPL